VSFEMKGVTTSFSSSLLGAGEGEAAVRGYPAPDSDVTPISAPPTNCSCPISSPADDVEATGGGVNLVRL
jgi:hypothetical protein